ncbi:unnamed protein product, partial [Effrenium voratum]
MEAATRLVRLAMEAATRPSPWSLAEKKKDLLEVVQSFHPEASVRLNVSTLLCLWWGEKRRPQAVGDTAAKQEAGLARQKEAPADVVMQDPPAEAAVQEHQDGPAPKRPRRNYLQEATQALTGLSVGVREVQDEKSLCISKVLYEPINREAIEELAETRASTYKESAAAQDLFDRPGRLYTGHRNNLYKGLMQELKKLEMQDQDNSDAIDKLLERIGMFPNLPTVFDGLD